MVPSLNVGGSLFRDALSSNNKKSSRAEEQGEQPTRPCKSKGRDNLSKLP